MIVNTVYYFLMPWMCGFNLFYSVTIFGVYPYESWYLIGMVVGDDDLTITAGSILWHACEV